MQTKQPKWALLANLGDVNPIDHGGGFVYVDTTETYPPELEVLEVDVCGADIWTVSRFCLDKCTYIDGVLSDNQFHPNHAAWFAKDVGKVASFIDVKTADLIEWLCSEDAQERARAYMALANWHGYANFDDYPLTFTDRMEVEKRYA